MSANLSREEIALLLSAHTGETLARSGDPLPEPEGAVKSFDLTANEERIVRGRLPGLEMVFERFCRSARTSLSKSLNRNTHFALSSIETVKFGLFLKKLPLPSSLHVFRVSPLPSQGLVFFATPLAFAIVEALLGGKGKKKDTKLAAREFSAIEARLIAKAAATILEELEQAWSAVDSLRCVYVRSELNPLAVNIVPSSDNVVLANIDVSVEETSASLVFCLPSLMLQPLREKLASGLQSTKTEFDEAARAKMRSHLGRTECEVRVRLAEGTVKVRDLLNLSPGDILPLATPAGEPAKVLVEGQVKFKGRAGTRGGNKAVHIIR